MKPTYGPRERAEALKLAEEIGIYPAARQLGIGPNTLKRWQDPELAQRENKANAERRRIPCRICGKPCGRYGRRIVEPELADLCHEHLVEALANRERGFTVEEIADMHLREHMSTNEIAHRVGRTQSAIHALLTRHGYEVRSHESATELRPGASFSGKLDRDEIYRLRDQGMSVPKIASHLGSSVSSIRYHLKRRPVDSV